MKKRGEKKITMTKEGDHDEGKEERGGRRRMR